jgi:hypothetical protein
MLDNRTAYPDNAPPSNEERLSMNARQPKLICHAIHRQTATSAGSASGRTDGQNWFARAIEVPS